MAVTALWFQISISIITRSARGLWSDVSMAHAIAEYNSGGMKLATAAKEFAVPRTVLRRISDYSDDDNRGLLACKRNSAFGLENDKFTEHILKLQIKELTNMLFRGVK
jgi:hypothetical protein